MSAPVAEPTKTPETETETPVEPTPETETEAPAPASAVSAPVDEELMQLVVNQEKEAEALKKKLAVYEEAESQRREQVRAKNTAMANALVENWSKSLTKEDFNDTSRHNILELAKKYPQETEDFFRVAHHASTKYVAKQETEKKATEIKKETELKQSFNQVMSKQVHAASKKTESDNKHFMSALNKYRVQGKGRELMDRVIDLQQPKRRRMY